jgi:hypothetical protein
MTAVVKPSEIYTSARAVAKTLSENNQQVLTFRSPRFKDHFISAPDGKYVIGCLGCPNTDPIGPRFIVAERDPLAGLWE